jgi:hypothetical protein
MDALLSRPPGVQLAYYSARRKKRLVAAALVFRFGLLCGPNLLSLHLNYVVQARFRRGGTLEGLHTPLNTYISEGVR